MKSQRADIGHPKRQILINYSGSPAGETREMSKMEACVEKEPFGKTTVGGLLKRPVAEGERKKIYLVKKANPGTAQGFDPEGGSRKSFRQTLKGSQYAE